MRNTRARRLVIKLLQTYARPLSLTEILGHIRQTLPGTAHSTVYRIVRSLEAEGALRRVDWRERGSRFEWSALPHHHHIVCRLCGETLDITDADMAFDEAGLRAATGYLINHHTIELEGICPTCQSKTGALASAPL